MSEIVGSWNETQAGTNAGATATHAAVTGRLHAATHISGYSDADSIITIHDGDGTATTLWATKLMVATNGQGFAINLPNGVKGTSGNAISAKIASSTAACQINIIGTTIPPNASWSAPTGPW
jgi:hypothetical protein